MKTTLLGTSLSALLVLAFGAHAEASYTQGPYSVDVLIEGAPQPMYVSDGRAFVAGVFGAAYQVRVHNGSGRRVEAVVAVDGRDVVTGQPVDLRRHRGHIVPPWGTTSIDGFRSSESSVATFRFSTIPGSYAWRTGTSWGIGTIRVWIFDEATPMPPPQVVLPGGAGAPSRRSRSASGAMESAPSAPRDMGTEYGEQRWSPVTRTAFVRRSPYPSAVLGIRYQSSEALVAAGILRPAWQQPVYYPHPVVQWWEPPHTYAPPPPNYPY